MQLAAAKQLVDECKALKCNIFGISPDLDAGLETVINEKQLNFPLLSDTMLVTSEAFGIAFRLDDATVALYLEKYKIDIERASGQIHHHLPVPSVYVIDASGTIRFAYSNPEHTVRLSNEDIMKEVRAL